MAQRALQGMAASRTARGAHSAAHSAGAGGGVAVTLVDRLAQLLPSLLRACNPRCKMSALSRASPSNW